MNRNAYTILAGAVVLGVATVVFGGDAKQDAAQKELKRLQGTWEAVAAVIDGIKQVPQKGKGHHLVIQGDAYTLESAGKPFGKGTLRVDPAKKPPALDLTPADGDSLGKPIPCIYELTGDELRVCMGRIGKARPAEFVSREGSKHILNTYRRLTPKE
jgi:uncharacterized protein (TIGR03067 family)